MLPARRGSHHKPYRDQPEIQDRPSKGFRKYERNPREVIIRVRKRKRNLMEVIIRVRKRERNPREINELINYNRLYVVPKKGSKSEEDGGDSEDGSSSDDGSLQDGGSSECGEVTPAQPEPSGDDNSGGGIPGNGEGGEG